MSPNMPEMIGRWFCTSSSSSRPLLSESDIDDLWSSAKSNGQNSCLILLGCSTWTFEPEFVKCSTHTYKHNLWSLSLSISLSLVDIEDTSMIMRALVNDAQKTCNACTHFISRYANLQRQWLVRKWLINTRSHWSPNRALTLSSKTDGVSQSRERCQFMFFFVLIAHASYKNKHTNPLEQQTSIYSVFNWSFDFVSWSFKEIDHGSFT